MGTAHAAKLREEARDDGEGDALLSADASLVVKVEDVNEPPTVRAIYALQEHSPPNTTLDCDTPAKISDPDERRTLQALIDYTFRVQECVAGSSILAGGGGLPRTFGHIFVLLAIIIISLLVITQPFQKLIATLLAIHTMVLRQQGPPAAFSTSCQSSFRTK